MDAIVPAILPTSREDLDEKLLALQGIASHVQIDIVDGKLAGPTSWPYSAHDADEALSADTLNSETLSYLGALHLEMDLMVQHPEQDMKRFIEAGANRITLHAEFASMLPKLLSEIETQYGHEKELAPGLLSIGLAIHANTDTDLIEPYLEHCDYVQFMGIAHIGRQGEPFVSSVVPKIQAFHKKHPQLPLQVDGGVSLATAPELLAAGVSRLIVGSAFWNAKDMRATYAQFVELTERYGVYS